MCDDYFLQLAEADICNFFEKISLPSVDILLFPPLLSRYRYSIHKIVEDSFPDLQTVSVGQEDDRRTAVHLGRKGVEAVMSAETPSSTPQKSAFQKDSDLKNSNRPDKRNAKPSMQPYIPPPQRNRGGASSPRPEKNFASMERSLKTGLRKKDAKLGKEGQKKTIPIKSRSSETEVSIVGDDLRKEASDVHIESQGPCQSQLPEVSFHQTRMYAAETQDESPPSNDKSLKEPTSCPNPAPGVSHHELQIQAAEGQNHDSSKNYADLEESEEGTQQPEPGPTSVAPVQRSCNRVILHADSEELVDLVSSSSSSIKPLEAPILSPGILKVANLAISSDSEESNQSWRRKSPPETPIPTSNSDTIQTEKFQKGSSLMGDVGEKSDGDVRQTNPSENWTRRSRSPQDFAKKQPKKSQVSVLKSPLKPEGRTNPSTVAEPNLSAAILEELTAAFGEDVAVHQVASSSYRGFSPVTFDGSSTDGYLHVLEVYDIPPTFSTTDLTREIQTLTRDFIEVQWVDETHALCLCSSETAARKTLSMRSPVGKVKLRPLSEASDQSKKKAKASALTDSLGVSKQRPETNAAAARRMVAGALGMKIVVPKEKREQERQQLTSAKEKKVRVIKKKEDIWEGLD